MCEDQPSSPQAPAELRPAGLARTSGFLLLAFPALAALGLAATLAISLSRLWLGG